MIPRIIHQTYHDEQAAILKCSQKSIMNTNPDWKYMFWSDQQSCEIVTNHFPEFEDKWNMIPNNNIIKWDMLRLMLLHVHGGLYVDCDTIFHKSLDTILDLNADFVAVLKHGDKKWIKNHFFLACEQSDFLYTCLDRIFSLDSELYLTNTNNGKVHAISGGVFLWKQLTEYTKDNTINVQYLNPRFVTNKNLLHEGALSESYIRDFNWDDVCVEHLLNGEWC